MTELSTKTVKLILEATDLCTRLQVEGLKLDEEGIRGYNDDEGIIVANIGDHDFEFEALGLARLVSLRQKASLLPDLKDVTVEAVPKKNNPDVIERLTFDAGKMSFDFRCALPKAITDVSSTKFNLKPLFYFDITEEDVGNITRASSAMRSKNMTIQGNGSEVKFRFSDDAGDILNFQVDSDLESLGDDDNVSLTLNLKKMAPILKMAVQGGNCRINILKNNIIYIVVGNMDVLVMPEV